MASLVASKYSTSRERKEWVLIWTLPKKTQIRTAFCNRTFPWLSSCVCLFGFVACPRSIAVSGMSVAFFYCCKLTTVSFLMMHGRDSSKMNSATDLDFTSPALPTDSVGWTIPALAERCERGLEEVSSEVLEQNLEPVLQGLRKIDPYDIFPLEKVAMGRGPRITDRYVVLSWGLLIPTRAPHVCRYLTLSVFYCWCFVESAFARFMIESPHLATTNAQFATYTCQRFRISTVSASLSFHPTPKYPFTITQACVS